MTDGCPYCECPTATQLKAEVERLREALTIAREYVAAHERRSSLVDLKIVDDALSTSQRQPGC